MTNHSPTSEVPLITEVDATLEQRAELAWQAAELAAWRRLKQAYDSDFPVLLGTVVDLSL